MDIDFNFDDFFTDNPETNEAVNEEFQHLREIFKDPVDEVAEALEENEKLQKQIRASKLQVQNLLDKNELEKEQCIKELQREIKQKSSQYPLKPFSLFGRPYFRDSIGRVCPENKDVKTRRQSGIFVNAYFLPPKKWSPDEKKQLHKYVLQSIDDAKTAELNNREKWLKTKLSRFQLSKLELTKTKENLRNARTERIVFLRLTEYEKISKADKIDWLVVSKLMGKRDAEECELMWANLVQPSVNKKPFTFEEDQKLIKIAGKYDYQDWDAITTELKTNRSAFKCFKRYWKHLNPDFAEVWTKEEDEKLSSAIERHKVGNVIKWHLVANSLEGRQIGQIRNHWYTLLKQKCASHPWTKEEDAVLLATVLKYPGKWEKAYKLLPIRFNENCKFRYTNFLDPEVELGGWTLEEDRLLIQKIVEFKDLRNKWVKMVEFFPNRTRNSLRHRNRTLKDSNVRKYNNCLQMCKEGLPPEKFLPFQFTFTCGKWHSKMAQVKEIQKEAIDTFVAVVHQKHGIEMSRDYDQLSKDIKAMGNKAFEEVCELLMSNVDYEKSKTFNKCPENCAQICDKHLSAMNEEDGDLSVIKPSDKDELSMIMDSGKEAQNNNDEEEDIYDNDAKELENLSNEEHEEIKQILCSRLDNLLTPRTFMGHRNFRRKAEDFSSKISFEYATMLNYLSQVFGSQSIEPIEETRESGLYTRSCRNVMEALIFPNCEDLSFPSMPPNNISMTETVLFLLMRSFNLEPMGFEFTPMQQYNLKLLNKARDTDELSCYFCQDEKKFEGKCYCESLKFFFERIVLLRKRLMSCSFWPILMSSVQPNSTQIENMIISDPDGVMPNKKKPRVKKRKLNDEKDFNEDMMDFEIL